MYRARGGGRAGGDRQRKRVRGEERQRREEGGMTFRRLQMNRVWLIERVRLAGWADL